MWTCGYFYITMVGSNFPILEPENGFCTII